MTCLFFQWVRMVCGNSEEQKCHNPLNFFSKPSFCTAAVLYIQWVSSGAVLYAEFTNTPLPGRNEEGVFIQGQWIIWVKDLMRIFKHLEPDLPAQLGADTGCIPRDKFNYWHMGVAVWRATLMPPPRHNSTGPIWC